MATYTWKSQPYLLGKFPAANLLLSFAILSAGASVQEVILLFKHMGLLVITNPPSTIKDISSYQLLLPSGAPTRRKLFNL